MQIYEAQRALNAFDELDLLAKMKPGLERIVMAPTGHLNLYHPHSRTPAEEEEGQKLEL